MTVLDLTGQRFGWLTVRERRGSQPGGGHNALWLCICACGAEHTVATDSLQAGNTQSCGCKFRRRVASMRGRSRRFGDHLDAADAREDATS